MAARKSSTTSRESVRSSTASGEVLSVPAKRHRRTKAEMQAARNQLAEKAAGSCASVVKSSKNSGGSSKDATSTVRPGRSRAAKVEQAIADRMATKGKESGRSGRTKPVEVDNGTNGDSSRSICRFCGGSFGSSNGESHLVQLDIRIDDRRIKTRELRLCNECIHWLPQYIGGAMTMEMNMPREKFHGAWTYPPVEMEIVES